MKVTNRLHLPEAFVKAVSVERHNKAGCYSATTLNKGTKEIILCKGKAFPAHLKINCALIYSYLMDLAGWICDIR